jgi:glycerate kinase
LKTTGPILEEIVMSTWVPSQFVVAPSGFKESLSAEQAADAIASGIRRVLPGAAIRTGANQNYDAGIDAYECILPAPVDIEDAFRRAREFLTSATERVLRLILLGSTLGRPRLCG